MKNRYPACSERKRHLSGNEATIQMIESLDFGKYVGQIPFNEGNTASGGKTYSIPIATAPVNSSAPQISITYNSQAGNGVAGYGWNLSGASSITVSPKTIYYDNTVSPIDLSKPSESAFVLDGTRLVSNTGSLSEYHYETAQGFILVKKHLLGNNVSYFTVSYPDGSRAIFGYTNNTSMKHVYPIREFTDIKGYKINFEYLESANNYWLSKVSYGGKTNATHTAEIQFTYETRTDYTTTYLSSLAISADRILKNITSYNKVDGALKELSSYDLSHEFNNNAWQLSQIDCSSDGSSLNPLRFSYEYYFNGQPASLSRELSKSISSYFSSSSGAEPVFVRGKFIKNNFGDGLITFPGKFSSYTKIGEKVKTFLGKVVGRYAIYGSSYPEDQSILIAPGLSFYSPTYTIKTEKGFQTIQSVDINGDGVDEIVKINFGELSGDNTILKITIYTYNGSGISSQYFSVPVKGVVSDSGETTSPMSREYYFGDFRGNGKTQLLTVSHNRAFTGADMTSYFALIDLDTKTKLSETTLFPLGLSEGVSTNALDMDGDGKMELCHATSSGMNVYGLSGNTFSKLYTTTSINNTAFNGSMILGDLNGDGKIDILSPPLYSYYDNRSLYMPVWAPRECWQCGISYPIDREYSHHCRGCGLDISKFIRLHEASCIECESYLQSCAGHGVPQSVDNACCPNHGSIFFMTVYFGYVNKGNTWTAYYSTGKGFESRSMNISTRESLDQFLLMDINNDGNADFLRVRSNKVDLFLNKNGNIQSVSESTVNIPAGTKILPANVSNYYSMSHFIAIENAEVNCYKYTKDNSKAHLLTTLIDSYGNRYVNDYLGMADGQGNLYNATNTPYYYPYFSLIAPLNLLRSSIIYSYDNTPVKRDYYTYYGAVMHRTGLGFGGFEKVVSTDLVSGITSEEERDPSMFGVTTKLDTPYKTVSYSYWQDYNSNRKNNPKIISVSETDKLTNIETYSSYQYDSYNNPTKVTQNIGSSSGITYITEQTYSNIATAALYLIGQPLTKTVASTRGGSSWKDKEVISYDASSRLPLSKTTYTGTSAANKTGETKWTYDANGNMTSEKSAPYNVTEFLGNEYSYDSSERYVATVTNALGQTTTYSNYDKYGNPKIVTDYKGRTTTHEYDDWGGLSSTLYPDGTAKAIFADWGGEGLYTVRQTSTGQPETVVHYDALGRELRQGSQRFDGQWQYVDKTYDSKGRLKLVSLPFKSSSPGAWTEYDYDTYNRPVTIMEASGKSTSWSYMGLSVTETKNGIATTKTTDASGALISVADPGGTITYSLRPDGQPSSITAPGGVVTYFGYDDFGRQTSINDPSAGMQTFSESFTTLGVRTTSVKDANNKTVTTITDKYGRVTSVNRPEFSTTYAYNSDGQLISETSTNETSTIFTYDVYDRPATVRDNAPDGKYLLKTFSYASGNVSNVQYESQGGSIGTENFVYTNGHNTEIKLNGTTTIWKLTEENTLGQPTKAVTGSIERTYSYTAYGMPTGRTAGSLQNFTYSFDVQKGNLLSRKDNGRNKTETFGYDNLNRLESIGTQHITYETNGNITSMPGVGTLAYENSAKPYQVTMLTPTGTAVPIREQNVTYTSYQRPSTISENGITASFAYNSAGDRVKMDVKEGSTSLLTRYYIGKQYELDTQTNTERLYLGGDAYSAPAICVKEGSDNWKVYYIFRDYLGSITHIANSDGSLKQELSYDAWGRLRNPTTQEAYTSGSEPALFIGRGYTGHEHLPWFGLVNMNARLYDPLLGRFLSPDPYVQAPDFTQNFNRYSYALNNPLVYIDQDGESILLLIGGALIGAYLGGLSSNKGELNPFQWNWKDPMTYLGVGFGAILGYTAIYGFLNPGTVGYTFGVNNAWGSVSVTLGGAAFGSDRSFQWTTSAGGGGKISNKNPQTHIKMPAYQAPHDSRFFSQGYEEASKLLVYDSKQQGVETVMYYTDKGYYFEQTSGYVFGDMSKSDYSDMYTYYGERGNGTPVYYAKNGPGDGVLFSLRTRSSLKNNIYEIYLDLGMGSRHRVLEYYHTHPRNTYLSENDPFQGIIPTYAIGWDGVRRGADPMRYGGRELDEIIIIAPAPKK